MMGITPSALLDSGDTVTNDINTTLEWATYPPGSLDETLPPTFTASPSEDYQVHEEPVWHAYTAIVIFLGLMLIGYCTAVQSERARQRNVERSMHSNNNSRIRLKEIEKHLKIKAWHEAEEKSEVESPPEHDDISSIEAHTEPTKRTEVDFGSEDISLEDVELGSNVAAGSYRLSSDELEEAGIDQEIHHENECPICWEEFHASDLVCVSNNPKCNHVYHPYCMERWLIRHSRCPVCRHKYLRAAKSQEHSSQLPSVADIEDDIFNAMSQYPVQRILGAPMTTPP